MGIFLSYPSSRKSYKPFQLSFERVGEMKKKIEWKWLGKNEFVPGCPARDLLEGEAERRGISKIVKESKLFERVERKAAGKELKDGA